MEPDELVTVYITKYALTRGIYRCQGKISALGYFSSRRSRYILCAAMGRDAFLTLEEAQENAVRKAERAIVSTRRKLTRMQSVLKDYTTGRFSVLDSNTPTRARPGEDGTTNNAE